MESKIKENTKTVIRCVMEIIIVLGMIFYPIFYYKKHPQEQKTYYYVLTIYDYDNNIVTSERSELKPIMRKGKVIVNNKTYYCASYRCERKEVN